MISIRQSGYDALLCEFRRSTPAFRDSPLLYGLLSDQIYEQTVISVVIQFSESLASTPPEVMLYSHLRLVLGRPGKGGRS